MSADDETVLRAQFKRDQLEYSRRKRTVCNSTRAVHKKRRVPFTPGDVVSLGENVVGKRPTRLIMVLAVVSWSWRPVRWSGDRAACDANLLITVDGRLLRTTLLSSDTVWHVSVRKSADAQC